MTIRLILLGAAIVTFGCGPRELPIRAQLAEAGARAEIDRWADALELYRSASERSPEDPVVRFDLALALYRTGNREQAVIELARLDTSMAPAFLRARSALLAAQIAYEAGQDADESAALLRAAELLPERAEYAHAVAELARRQPDVDRGRWVTAAYELWPENSRLALDYSQWSFEMGDADRSLSILLELARGRPEIERYLELAGAAVEGGAERIPTEMRIAVNLLRGTKRFQNDAAELEGLLQLSPLVSIGSEAPAGEQSELRFELIPLLPSLPGTASVAKVVDIELLDDADDTFDISHREAGLVVATESALYVLERFADEFESITDLGTVPIGLLTGDLDDDGFVEILVFDESGVRVLSRSGSQSWSDLAVGVDLSSAGPVRSPLLVDFDHDGDLDLLAAHHETGLRVSLNRGEAGLGDFEPAPFVDRGSLISSGPVTSLFAADLDNDSDQDLLLATSDEVLVLRNWRQAELRIATRLPAASVEGILVVDLDGDRLVDLMTYGGAAGWRCWLGEERFRWRESDAENPADAFAAALGDFDLDGDLDLVTAGTNLEVRRSNDGRFDNSTVLAPADQLTGILAVDLDGDRDPDLLGWGAEGFSTWRSRGGEGHAWIELALRSPERKVPRDGHGVRIEASFGEQTRWWQLDRANPVIGFGADVPSVLKATWPNGISEYLFRPAVLERHELTLELRIEGSCPFLYASDGDEMRFVTDILGLSPLGMLMDGENYVPADPEEFLRLPDWVDREGLVELRLTEELREVAYLDQIELVVVDAPAEIAVYNHERWIPSAIQGLGLHWLDEIRPPLSVVDNRGNEVLDVVFAEDQRYLENHDGEIRYQGAVDLHRMTIELPPSIAAGSRPGLLLVGWLHWGNTSTNIARSQDPHGAPVFPYLEVENGSGGWQRTAIEVGLPAGKTKPVVVDLGPISELLGSDHRRVRLTTDFEVYWDRVAVISLVDAPAGHSVYRLEPRSAKLGFEGFSRWYRPATNGPYLFDYQRRTSIPTRETDTGRELALSWLEHEGRYTAFGEVDELLADADDRSVVFGSGEGLALTFDLSKLPSLPSPEWRRTLFFHSEGWEKDGDPNVACSRTVEPMPFRGMDAYPCGTDEPVLSGDSSLADDDSRTRWVSRHRLERRVELATPTSLGSGTFQESREIELVDFPGGHVDQ